MPSRWVIYRFVRGTDGLPCVVYFVQQRARVGVLVNGFEETLRERWVHGC